MEEKRVQSVLRTILFLVLCCVHLLSVCGFSSATREPITNMPKNSRQFVKSKINIKAEVNLQNAQITAEGKETELKEAGSF